MWIYPGLRCAAPLSNPGAAGLYPTCVPTPVRPVYLSAASPPLQPCADPRALTCTSSSCFALHAALSGTPRTSTRELRISTPYNEFLSLSSKWYRRPASYPNRKPGRPWLLQCSWTRARAGCQLHRRTSSKPLLAHLCCPPSRDRDPRFLSP